MIQQCSNFSKRSSDIRESRCTPQRILLRLKQILLFSPSFVKGMAAWLFVISRISPFPHACYAATIVSKPIPIPSTHAPRKINCGLFRVDSEDASIGWLIRYRLPPLAAGIRAPVVMARHRSDECLCVVSLI